VIRKGFEVGDHIDNPHIPHDHPPRDWLTNG
jgi:hypothetical protein